MCSTLKSAPAITLCLVCICQLRVQKWGVLANRLKNVFQRIQEASLSINSSKCAIAKKETKYLGYVVVMVSSDHKFKRVRLFKTVLFPVVERVLKKHTQVKVPLPSKKCSVSRVKVVVQKPT